MKNHDTKIVEYIYLSRVLVIKHVKQFIINLNKQIIGPKKDLRLKQRS